MNREQRRAAAKAARRQPGHARDTQHHKLMSACAFLEQIAVSRVSDGEPIPGDTSVLADYAHERLLQSINYVRGALERLSNHATDDLLDALIIHQALGIARVRAVQIGGEADNPALPYLDAGQQALQAVHDRYQRTGQWGFGGPERQAAFDGVDVYEELMRASSPQQRTAAMEAYEALLKRSGNGKLVLAGEAGCG